MFPDVADRPARVGWDRARSTVAAVLVVVGLVLTPVAVVAAHARPLLTDTDRFVASFGPLASDRGVQDAVADAAIAGVDARVDFSALAATALQNLGGQLSLPPAVVIALQALGDRAATALRGVVDDQIRSVVASDGFAAVWQQMLRTAHAQALAGVQGDPSAALVVQGDTLVLQVGPLVDRVRQALVDRGYRFAALLPQVDRTVELVDVPGLGQVVRGHRAVSALGVWLPVAAALLVAGGLLLARRRRPALLRAGAGLAAVSAVLLVVLALVRAHLAAPSRVQGGAALDRSRSLLRVAAYDVAANGVVRAAAILLVAGVVVAIAAHLVGRLLVPPPAAAPTPAVGDVAV
jgi:hypothetical protein